MRQEDEALAVLGPPTDADYVAFGCGDGEDGRLSGGAPADQLSAGEVLAMVGEAPSAWPDAAVAILRRLDPVDLSHAQLVDFVHAMERLKARSESLQVRALAVLDRRDDSGCQAVREDVACVLQISPGAAVNRLKTARTWWTSYR